MTANTACVIREARYEDSDEILSMAKVCGFSCCLLLLQYRIYMYIDLTSNFNLGISTFTRMMIDYMYVENLNPIYMYKCLYKPYRYLFPICLQEFAQ